MSEANNQRCGRKTVLMLFALLAVFVIFAGYEGYVYLKSGYSQYDPRKEKALTQENMMLASKLKEYEERTSGINEDFAQQKGNYESKINQLTNEIRRLKARLNDAESQLKSNQGQVISDAERNSIAKALEKKHKSSLLKLQRDKEALQREKEALQREKESNRPNNAVADARLKDRIAYLESQLEAMIEERRERQLMDEIDSRRKAELAADEEALRKREIAKLASVKEARRVELDKPSDIWRVKAASKDIAFLKNNLTGRSIKVTRGFDIPGCGGVVTINPVEQTVSAGKCIISQ